MTKRNGLAGLLVIKPPAAKVPAEVEPTPLESLVRYFRIVQNGSEWILCCKTCRARWALPVSDNPHVGNILKLLDHGRSHK